MLEQIKKIARQSDECAAPAMVLYGTVTGLDPLRVRVDNRFELGERDLTLLRGTRESLEAGDGLALLRNRGGQEFLVLGRL